MNVLDKERLNLRKLSADDAAFILELLNEASRPEYPQRKLGDGSAQPIKGTNRSFLKCPRRKPGDSSGSASRSDEVLYLTSKGRI